MLSAVILSKNSESELGPTLSSLSFCDEIIVIDDFSLDNTVDLAEKKGGKVFRHKLDSFSEARNFGMNKAKGDWILFIDDDEVVTQELQKEIVEKIKNNTLVHDAYSIRRAEFWHDKELRFGEVWKAREKGLLRLVKSGSGKWEGKVHETFNARGNFGRLTSYLNHYPHPNIASFLIHVNKYSSMRKEELLDTDARVSILDVIFYPAGKFIYSYFILLGFIDGEAGFIYSFMMSFHSFLTRAKLMVHRQQ